MDEPRNPTREQDLPASVSDQNGEEAEPGHDDRAHARRPAGENGHGGDSAAGGESGEGSQSTGDPNSAG
jgi:hypothetical protein